MAKFGHTSRGACVTVQDPRSRHPISPTGRQNRVSSIIESGCDDGVDECSGRISRQLVYGHFIYDTSSTDISSTDISSTDISSTDISSTMTFVAEIEAGVMK